MGSVDQSLYLGLQSIEVDRRCNNDHIGADHPVEDFRHIILLDAAAAITLTGVTGGTVIYCLVAYRQARW